MWVYIQTEPNLWTVGFYRPDGKYHTDSDHLDREKAAERVSYLNGNNFRPSRENELEDVLKELCSLKIHKEAFGKDAFYKQNQPKVWSKAFKLAGIPE